MNFPKSNPIIDVRANMDQTDIFKKLLLGLLQN